MRKTYIAIIATVLLAEMLWHPAQTAVAQITSFAGGGCVGTTQVCRSLNIDSDGNLQVELTGGSGGTVAATQSGTWTVQPGNTANTTAWLVTGTGGAFPVSSFPDNEPFNVAQIAGVATPVGLGAPDTALRIAGMTFLHASTTNITSMPTTAFGAALTLASFQCTNSDGANIAYVNLYDTTGAVTTGTTNPTDTLGIPAGSGNPGLGVPLVFTSGLKISSATTAGGSTSPDTGEINCSYAYRQ